MPLECCLRQELQKAAEQRSAFDAAQQQKDRTINQLKSMSAMGSGYVDWQYEAGGVWANMASDTAKEKDDP